MLHKVFVAIILVTVVGAIGLSFVYFIPSTGQVTASSYEGGAVRVGDETITAAEIDSAYEKIPEEIRPNITKSDVMEALVDQQLLLQQATTNALTATSAEVDAYVDQVKAAYELDDAGLAAKVVESGYTMDEYRHGVQEQISISKLLNEKLNFNNLTVTDAEVSAFIETNRQEFNEILEEDQPGLQEQFQARVRMVLLEEKQKQAVTEYLAELRKQIPISEVSTSG